MKHTAYSLLRSAFVAVVATAATAQAQLRFTEVMSQSGIGGGTADWFELTNFGSGAVDITGYKFDDGSFNLAAAVSLQGVTSIAAGQSVVFLETAVASPSDAIAAFRTFWGNIDSVVIGSYSGSGISFSSGGDGLSLFDAGRSLVTAESFGAATTGFSFGFNPTTSTFGAESANGSFGGFTSAGSPTNVGSPGAIPEPSTYAALVGALALAGVALRRRRA
jgi:hypothetical protein